MVAKIVCLNCDTLLVSKARHDFQSCGCENQTFVDGGEEDAKYIRYGAVDFSLIKFIEEGEDEKISSRRIRRD